MAPDNPCGLAAETKILAPEGSLTLRAAAGKAIPVLTRDAEDHLFFRLMENVRKIADDHPVIRIVLENGAAFRSSPEQVLFTHAMEPVRASSLRAGMRLKPAYQYPEGYVYRTDGGEEKTAVAGVEIAAVEPGGTAEIYSLAIHDNDCFFLDAGVLCKAETSA